jgi:hypothetical protein
MRTVVVSDAFDDLRSSHVRFLQEASKPGEVHVVLWPDRDIQAATGRPPRFPQEERSYLLQAIRSRILRTEGSISAKSFGRRRYFEVRRCSCRWLRRPAVAHEPNRTSQAAHSLYPREKLTDAGL